MNARRSVAALATLALAAGAPAAGRSDGDRQAAWLREHAVPLRTVDPAADDYADLQPLRAILAGRRVVVLGEATHGDGTLYLAKARLVAFLHRELGFEVLAFESGGYDCWRAWRDVRAGGDPRQAFRDSVFPIWTLSEQVQPLIDTFAAAATSPRPLELAGIDPQFTGVLSQRHLLDELAGLAQVVGMAVAPFRDRVAEPLRNLVEGRYEAGELPAPAARAAFVATIAELRARLARHEAEVEGRADWLQLLAGIRDFAPSSWATDFSRPLLEQPENYGVRERLMGERIAWLARVRHPGRRIVVWLHSGHAFRNVSGIDVPSPVHARLYRTLQPAGAVARQALGEELYVVGTLAYQGHFASVWGSPHELLRPTAGSLEDRFHGSGLTHAFLDLTADGLPRWLREPLIARPVGYKEMKASWRDVYDGFLFIDRMEASRRVEATTATGPGLD